MKLEAEWRPTKYVRSNGRLRASRDRRHVSVGSRLIGDLVASYYDECVPEFARGDLVDLGCGQVPLYASYHDLVSTVTCVDWNQPAIGPQHLDHTCDLSEVLPLNDNAYDTIILSDVIEHIPNPETLWSEMSRIARPGCALLLNTPFMHCLHEQPHDYFRYSPHALRYFAEKYGFDVRSLDAIGGTPEILGDIFAKHFQFVPVVGKPLAQLTQAFIATFVRMRPGSTISARTAEAFPLGYTLTAIRKA